MLEIKALSFSYDKKNVLHDINISFSSAKKICLMGHNGCGKSTLIKILCGKLPVQSGAITYEGNNAVDNNGFIKSKIREISGLLFQNPSSDEKLSVKENLVFSAMLLGLSKEERNEAVPLALKRADISDRKNEQLKKLSGGMKRRVEIYRAFMHKPKIILLDEPSAGLDPKETEHFYKFVNEYVHEHKALVIFSTHRTEEAIHADILIMMKNGKIIAADSPQKFLSDLNYLTLKISLISECPQTYKDLLIKELEIKAKSLSEDKNMIMAKIALENIDKILGFSIENKFINHVHIEKPSLKDIYKETI